MAIEHEVEKLFETRYCDFGDQLDSNPIQQNILTATAYFDNVPHFLSVQTAVSISVIDFERPFQFVLQFSTKNKMHSRHIFHEVYVTILRSKQEGVSVIQSL